MSSNKRYMTRKALPRRNALVIALALGMGVSGLAYGQATTGTIFGQAPVGETVVITGGSGIHRAITVGSSGNYSVTLPVGTYTVSLEKAGANVQSRENVSPPAGHGIEVDFVSAQQLSAVNVSANALPTIDVSSTTQQTTITATQLRHLPLQRSAAAIAMLAPGVGEGQAMNGLGATGQPLLSFGGATIAENAYYINGMNTTDPITGQGGVSLPYGSIEQQQTMTNGYSAKYGRSIGGVINQIGKSGTNEWHFGGQVLWRPRGLRGTEKNSYWSNPAVTSGAQAKGQLRGLRSENHQWTTIYDAYLGGPLIKDKLFFFASGEWEKQQKNSVGSVGADSNDFTTVRTPKLYTKIDWNINDNNILSGSYMQNKYSVSGNTYHWNDAEQQTGGFKSADQSTSNKFKIWSIHYTSYITDNLTLNAMYGKMDGTYFVTQPPFPGFDPTAANILGGSNQDPSLNGNNPAGILGSNPNTNISNPAHKTEVTSKRLSLTYHIGINDITVGMDNLTERDNNDGSAMTGPGYAWSYGKNDPNKAIQGIKGQTGYVSPPGGKGYYVSKYIFENAASVRIVQRAVYAEDKIQLTPRWLLNVGLRNDQFTNYNSVGVPYVRVHSGQIAPRLGISWDVFGDSSLKVFANAGRYYLALPAGVALREASASTFTQQYFTYTGIDPETGVPLGLKQIPTLGANGGQVVYVNGESGQPLDPKLVSSKDLKAEYQDNFAAGVQWQFNPNWVAGLTLRYSKLGRIMDDFDPGVGATAYNRTLALLKKAGAPMSQLDLNYLKTREGSVLINPGDSNDIPIPLKNGGIYYLHETRQDMLFPKASRSYYAAEFSLTHPFDGKWFGKVDYVFSRSYGNTEGPVQSNIGQAGTSVSITEQWDFPELMYYAGGEQANDRTHVLKAYGYYQVTPEWSVSGNVYIASGTPKSCLGRFGADESDPIGYGSSYHFCGGRPTPPGTTGHTPWRFNLDLGVTYLPNWADNKLGFHMNVHNVTNEQKVTQIYPIYGSNAAPNPAYLLPQGFETPRYFEFSVTYDY